MLKLNLPVTGDEEARDEIVVVSVKRSELTEEEHLVGEAIHEGWVLDDVGADNGSTARHDEDSAIYRISGSQLAVVSLEVYTAKEVEEGTEAQTSWLPSNFLACTDTADSSVLEGSNNCWKKVETGPEDMVICKDSNAGLDMRNRSTYLTALTRDFCSEDGQFGDRICWLKALDHGLTGALVEFSDSNDDDCGRRVHQDAVKAFVEVVVERIDRRHNDRAVSSSVAWLGGDRSRLIDEEVGDDVNYQSQVSEAKEKAEEKVLALSGSVSCIEYGQSGRRHKGQC